MSMEHWRIDTDKGHPKYYEKTCPKDTSSTTNLTRIFLRLNLDFHREIFSHGTALTPSCMQTHTGYINTVSDKSCWHVPTTWKIIFFWEPLTFDRKFTLSWVTLNQLNSTTKSKNNESLKMKAKSPFETSVTIYPTTQHQTLQFNRKPNRWNPLIKLRVDRK
jgi:hypothetical protein